MDFNDIAHIGEDIASSVNNSIKSGDFSHLSNDIGNITSRFSGQVVDEAHGTPDKHAYGEPVHKYGQTSYSYDNQRRFEQQNVQQQNVQQQNVQQQNVQQQNFQKQNVYAADYRNHCPVTFNMNRTKHGTGIAEIVLGILGSAVFGISFVSVLISSIFISGGIALSAAVIATGAFLVLSIVGIVRGSSHSAISSDANEMSRMIGARTSVPVDELSRRSGKSNSQIVKELKKLISAGIIPQGKFDENQTVLMLTDDMYKQYCDTEDEKNRDENEKKAREKQQQENYSSLTPDVRAIIDEGSSYITQIHEFNNRIPDKTMSDKLDKLEDIMKKIFEQVEKKPSSADELHKFMGYYLPTTTKLIKAYIDVNEQPVEGQNISETKYQIEETLDVINEAFEKLLDSMFEDMNWDIRSDINVMKTMMAQDGLTKNSDFGSSGQNSRS